MSNMEAVKPENYEIVIVKKGVVYDKDYTAYKVTKVTSYDKSKRKAIRQYSLRKLILESITEKLVIPIGEIRLLRKNEHPKITLQPESINYLKKVVIRRNPRRRL